jgi:hypothetical protein
MSLDDIIFNTDKLVTDRRILGNATPIIQSHKQRDLYLLVQTHAAESTSTHLLHWAASTVTVPAKPL